MEGNHESRPLRVLTSHVATEYHRVIYDCLAGRVTDSGLYQTRQGGPRSLTTPSAITNTTIPFWTTIQGPCWRTLAALVDEARTLTGDLINWRVLPDGSIYFGAEPWPQATLATFDLLSWSPQQLETTIYAPNPNVLPGQIWQQGQVSNVEHVVNPDRIRTRVWFLDPDPSSS